MRYSNFNRSSNRNNQPLTIEQVAQLAPSAFATEAHSSRSSKYTYIPTVDVIKGMMAAGFVPFKAQQSSSRIEGKSEFTKHMIRFRFQGSTAMTAVGDTTPEIVMVNSHDGTSAYKLMAGIFRLACLNGMMVCESEIGSVSVFHKGNVLDNVIEGSCRIVDDSAKMLNSVNTWKQLQLTNGEQNALAEAAHTLRFSDTEGKVTTPITAAQLLTTRRDADTGADLWTTFNRVQENVIRGGLHGVTRVNGVRRNVTTREVRGIDQDVKLNRALWQLAAKMAELKGA